MDWEEEELSATQLQALEQAEQAYNVRRSGGSEAQGPPASEQAAVQAVVPAGRRRLPAVLSAQPAAASGGADQAATGRAMVASADENLPPACFGGTLRYAFTGYEVDSHCKALLDSGIAAVGFDIEWRVTYQTGVPPRPVALIQLCFLEGEAAAAAAAAGNSGGGPGMASSGGLRHCCLLLHICHSGLTPHLKQLLCSKEILKVGVGIHGDVLKLRRDFQLEMAGVCCLSDYANARLVGAGGAPDGGAADATAAAGAAVAEAGSGSIEPAPAPRLLLAQAAPQRWSLAGLVGLLMRQPLEKSQAVRCSNWEQRPPLREEQLRYAATDAWSSLRVYEILSKMPVVAPPQRLPAGPAAMLPAGGAVLECAAAAAAGAAAGCPSAAGDWVPPCAALRHLQPAKLAVYQALMQQGLSVQQVAAQRHIQEDSVQGYMAEAITAGLGYSWSCLGVPASALQLVADTCSSLLDRPFLRQPGVANVQPVASEAQQQGGCQVGDKRPPPCSPGSLAAAAPPPAGSTEPAAAPAGGSSSNSGPVDVLEQLLAAGHKMRELKEARFADISYGQLRLALAHLGRCNPAPWE